MEDKIVTNPRDFERYRSIRKEGSLMAKRRKYKNKFTGPHVDSVLRKVKNNNAVVSSCPACGNEHIEILESYSSVHHSRNCKYCGTRFYSVLHAKANHDIETQKILKEMHETFEKLNV